MQCIESCNNSDIPVQIIIIDNNSSDGTYEFAQVLAQQYKNIKVILSKENIGLAAANNLAIPHLKSEYTLILNPDTILETNTLSVLVNALKVEENVGAVGPLNLYEDGSRHTSFHTSWTLMHLIAWRLIPYSFIRGVYDKYSRYKEKYVLFVSGSCLLLKKEIFLKVGGYDPKFFLTVEDACDLCLRIRKIGYRTKFIPIARMVHLCGKSGSQVPYLALVEGYKGDIYFFKKHYGDFQEGIAFLIIKISCYVKILISLIKVKIKKRAIDELNLNTYLKALNALNNKFIE